MKASSQCVKIIVYLTGSLHDLLPLLDIVGQYFPNELIVIELFGEKSLVIFLNSVIKTKDKIKIAHLNIYQFKKKIFWNLIRLKVCPYKVMYTCLF